MTDTLCARCGVSILEATAQRTGSLCAPCSNGTRESIEAGKAYHKKERELDATDPFRLLWKELVRRVHHTDAGYTGLSDAQKQYFAVGLLVGEVYNGGFDQFFLNSSGSHSEDAELGLKAMGAAQSLALLKRAKQIVFGDKAVPVDTEQRRTLLRELSNKTAYENRLEELDDQFWKDPDKLQQLTEVFARNRNLV